MNLLRMIMSFHDNDEYDKDDSVDSVDDDGIGDIYEKVSIFDL